MNRKNKGLKKTIELHTDKTQTIALVESLPAALLFVDEDEHPDWLTRSIKEHLQYMPYYMCLGKVVDLFLTQEARLGYPAKVIKFYSCVFVC